MPIDSKFRPSADIGKSEQTALLHEESNEDTELRRHRNAKPSVRRHDRGQEAGSHQITSADEEHWDACAILCREPDLGVFVVLGVEWNASRCPCLRLPDF